MSHVYIPGYSYLKKEIKHKRDKTQHELPNERLTSVSVSYLFSEKGTYIYIMYGFLENDLRNLRIEIKYLNYLREKYYVYFLRSVSLAVHMWMCLMCLLSSSITAVQTMSSAM